MKNVPGNQTKEADSKAHGLTGAKASSGGLVRGGYGYRDGYRLSRVGRKGDEEEPFKRVETILLSITMSRERVQQVRKEVTGMD